MDKEQIPQEGMEKKNRGRIDLRPYIGIGLTMIIVFVICLALFFLVFRYQGWTTGIGKAFRSIAGILIGLVLAYLLNPIMKFFEERYKKLLFRKRELKTLKQRRVLRGLSVGTTMAIFLAAIVFLMALIIPQLIRSVQDLIQNMNEFTATFMGWMDKLSNSESQASGMTHRLMTSLMDYVRNWIEMKFASSTELMDSITTGVYSVVKGIVAVIIGLITCIFLLMRKEQFLAQGKKIVFAIFKNKSRGVAIDIIRQADRVFGGFFIGKIIDSIIIGLIAFVCVYFMKMPYPTLLAVIIGVTNIVPIFGPYFGAIPCLFLVFLVSPIKALYLLIFIIILQQVDGNVIGPKILGDSVGLNPFWIIFAVLLFGGCFGVIGMVFGVPIWALIYYIIKRIVEYILEKRKLPTKTVDYIPPDSPNREPRRRRLGLKKSKKPSEETDKEETDKE